MNNIIHQPRFRGLLNALITADDKGCTIRSLAEQSGVPYVTAWRIIKSLENTGALKIRKVGAVCLVFPDRNSVLWDNLTNVTHVEDDTLLSSLKKEFEFISRDVAGVLLCGSHAKGTANKRSDIDICIVKRATARSWNVSMQSWVIDTTSRFSKTCRCILKWMLLTNTK